MFFKERRNTTVYMHNCRLKITLPSLHHLHHQTPSSPPDNSWNHSTPSDTTLQASDKQLTIWHHLTPSDTILHHLHHLTTDGYIGHICSPLRSWVWFSLRTHVKRVCQHSTESRAGFPGRSGFLPQEKLTGWVRINTVKKVISQLL
jgi:hypothetical protein